MKFLLTLLGDEEADRTMSPEAMEALVEKHGEFTRALRYENRLLASGRLRFSDEARTLRREGGDWLVVDGPYAETKEQFGGYYLIEAGSREEAVEWAKRVPYRADTAVEVRPCRTGAEWSGPLCGKRSFLIAFVAATDEPMDREQIFRSIDRHYELSIKLASEGKFVGSRSLDPPARAVTVRHDGDLPLVIDGPFAETKEFMAGYFVVAADSLEEALEWARELSEGSRACEVRPFWD
jgi:hypothetical protein